MTPSAQLTWACAVVATLLVVLAFALLGTIGGVPIDGWADNAAESVTIAPAASCAASLAAWGTVRWWRAVDDLRRWSAFGMALRTVVSAFLLFPPLTLAWLAGAGVLMTALSPASEGVSYADTVSWAPGTAVYATLFGVMFGALPALLATWPLCRRFLRQSRTAGGLR